MEIQTFFFNDDGTIPNSHLPVVLYKNAANGENMADHFEDILKDNNWGNNWRDIVLPFDHFHSNTHEVLCLAYGKVTLKIGGKQGKLLEVNTGDVLIIPAGVGHYANTTETDYIFVGGYPNGAAWDTRIGLPEERQIDLQNLAKVLVPQSDPIFGNNGQLMKIWNIN
jgi:uncharacterized protein YjlB